jgi:hypothetical protein
LGRWWKGGREREALARILLARVKVLETTISAFNTADISVDSHVPCWARISFQI